MQQWQVVDTFGFLYTDLSAVFEGTSTNQPVYVLRAPTYQHVPQSNGAVASLPVVNTKGLDLKYEQWKRSVVSWLGNGPNAGSQASVSGSMYTMYPGDNLYTRWVL
jgi:hypothetical protein